VVTLSGVSFTDFTGNTTRLSPERYAQAAAIRPGISTTYLDTEVFEALANGFGARGTGLYVVACRTADLEGTVDFEFGGPDGTTIKVPIKELVGDQIWDSQSFDDPSGGCELQLSPPTLGRVILGERFLRHAYAVFDLDSDVAALAQAAGKSTDSMNVVQWSSDFDVLGASVTASLSATIWMQRQHGLQRFQRTALEPFQAQLWCSLDQQHSILETQPPQRLLEGQLALLSRPLLLLLPTSPLPRLQCSVWVWLPASWVFECFDKNRTRLELMKLTWEAG